MTLEEILRQAQSKPCTCGGAWIPAALDILWQNWIDPYEFARAVLLNLRHGPKKGLTMLLVGVTTSEKTWLLLPLTVRRDRERGDRDGAGAR